MDVVVVVFPGSNCEHDVVHVYSRLLRQRVRTVWHREHELGRADLVILPGGFSYGDYLRTGALAKLSPIMRAVRDFAVEGGPVLGICNGFQILCEAQLLPGALLRNRGGAFLSRFVHLRVEHTTTPFTKGFRPAEVLTCPIAHGEGNYFADRETLQRIEGEGQVVLRYCDPEGRVDEKSELYNPNGSLRAIAGVCNEQGNVVGIMPHPERAAEALVGGIGGASGLTMFSAALRG